MVSLLLAGNAVLAVCYLALIAGTMAFAAIEVEFAENVRGDEAQVAQLESQYFAKIASINTIDYVAHGYVKPMALIYVPSRTDALTIR